MYSVRGWRLFWTFKVPVQAVIMFGKIRVEMHSNPYKSVGVCNADALKSASSDAVMLVLKFK